MKKVFVFLVALTSSAFAQEAEEDGLCAEHVYDPPAVAWRESGIDAPRAACRHADLALTLGGRLVYDPDDFYGTGGAGVTFGARFVDGEHLEWGFALRVLDATTVQNAVLTVDELGYGPLQAHLGYGTLGRAFGVPRRSFHYVRAELPFTRSRLDGSSGALQLGHASTWLLTPRLQFHGHAALLGWYASSTSGRDGRASLTASADVGWLAAGWLTVFAGGDAQLGWYGWTSPVLAARAGAHWRIKGLWRADLAAGRPLLGDERADLHLTLGVRRDLD
jgi:hypothetical protein